MRVAFFDVDGTLTETRVWRGLMAYFKRRGLRRTTYAVFWLYHMSLYFLYRLGLIPQTGFRAPWARHLPWFFRGYGVEQAQEIWDWVVRDFLSAYWRGDSLGRMAEHKRKGDLVVLVSASPTPLVERIARELGADYAVGTRPRVRRGKYTGGISGPVCIAEHKASLVQELLEARGVEIDYPTSYSYADSPGDLSMLEMVGHPVATHPDDELRPIAESRGWRIFPDQDQSKKEMG